MKNHGVTGRETKMMICPKCCYGADGGEFSVSSTSDGTRMQILCPKCGRYSRFVDRASYTVKRGRNTEEK